MGDDKGSRTVGISDIPKTIKGYQWFEQVAGRSISIESVSLIGNNKGATRYAALVICKSRDQAKDFVRRIKDRNEAPRGQLLNDDKEVDSFRNDMVKSKGWSKNAPDGDRGITPNSGADIRGDATGFKHGYNPYRRGASRSRSNGRSRRRSRSRSRRRSRSRSRSGSRRRRDSPRSPSRKDRGGSRSRSRSRRSRSSR
eukprot:TRINITY_DN49971_c0_g1_i1.p1 TRINITY_DN49971_c0_g1~~TRINITY_DN49971_c0_g1_i1.p1  ORF type:complete len:198 (-),score=13.56 TRINITY_DN49971_c0_g1_i1:154-747(-)